MSLMNVLIKDYGWSLMCIPARYNVGPDGTVIMALAYSSDTLNELMDTFVSGGSLGTDAERVIDEILDYPIVRAPGAFIAFENLEKKLMAVGQRKIYDSDWRTDVTVKLQNTLDQIHGRAK